MQFSKMVLFQEILGFLTGHCANLFEPNSSWVAVHFVFVNVPTKLAALCDVIQKSAAVCAALCLMCCWALLLTHKTFYTRVLSVLVQDLNIYACAHANRHNLTDAIFWWNEIGIVYSGNPPRLCARCCEMGAAAGGKKIRWKKAGMMERQQGMQGCERSDGRQNKLYI